MLLVGSIASFFGGGGVVELTEGCSVPVSAVVDFFHLPAGFLGGLTFGGPGLEVIELGRERPKTSHLPSHQRALNE